MINLKSSVDRYSNNESDVNKVSIFHIALTLRALRASYAMMLIARCYCFFTVLQFVVITGYYASFRLV